MGDVTLYYGPAGCGKTRLVVDRFGEVLAEEEPDRSLWDFPPRVLFLAPDAEQARRVRRELTVRCGLAGLVGPVVVTFGGLYEVIFRLAGKTVPPVLSEVARRALLRRLLEELASEGALRLFGEAAAGEGRPGAEIPLYRRPGFISALDGFIQELKQGAKEPAHFSAALDTFGRDDRSRDLEVVYRRYQEWLTDHRLYDGAGLSWYARDLLAEVAGAFSDLRLLVVDGFVTFTPTQVAILEQLARRARETLLTLTYEEDAPAGAERSEPYRHTRRTYHLLRERLRARPRPMPLTGERPAPLAHLERNLFRWPPGGTTPADPEHLQVLETPGDWREALEVAREIKRLIGAGYCRPDEVLILCRSRRRHGSLLARACARLGVPLRSGPWRSLLEAPVVGVFLKVLRVAVEDWPRELVCEVLSSPYLGLTGAPADQVDVEAVAARAYIVGGRDQWVDRLGRLRERLTLEAEAPEDVEVSPEEVRARRRRRVREARDCEAVIAAGDALASALEVLPEEASPVEFAAAARGLIDRLGLRGRVLRAEPERSRDDLAALGRLEELLEELAGPPPAQGHRISREEFVREVALAASEVYFETGPTSDQAVTLREVHEARGLFAPVVFVVGLVEGVFPTTVAGRAFYSEAERQSLNRLGLGLEQQEDVRCREMFLFYTAVTRATRRLYLTYPATDSRGKAQLRSHFVDEVEVLLADPERCRRSVRLSDWPPAPAQAADTEELLEGWVAASAERPGPLTDELAAAAALLAEADPRRLEAVCEGAAQVRQREGPGPLDAYDGVLSGERARALLAREFGPERLYSASQFDAYARCPFTFFLKHLLGLEPPQLPPERMEPADLGLVCHQVLAGLYRRCREKGVSVREDLVSAYGLLDEELEKVFNEELRLQLGLSRALAAVYRDEVRELLARLLRERPEAEGFSGLEPRFFELAFGQAERDDVDPASVSEPLRLSVEGGEVLVRGRIDRVDVSPTEEGRFGILDYKLGRQGVRLTDLKRGRHTQLAIYVAACQELFFPGGRCEVAGLLSISGARLFHPIRSGPPLGAKTHWMPTEKALEYLRRYVGAYVGAMRRGLFPPAPAHGRTCSRCEFSPYCRHEPARIERKLGEEGRDGLLGLTGLGEEDPG